VKFEAQVTGPDIDGDYDWELTIKGDDVISRSSPCWHKTQPDAEGDLDAYLTQIGATIDT